MFHMKVLGRPLAAMVAPAMRHSMSANFEQHSSVAPIGAMSGNAAGWGVGVRGQETSRNIDVKVADFSAHMKRKVCAATVLPIC